MRRRYTQELAGFASPVSKALVNSGSSKPVNITSINMVKDFQLSFRGDANGIEPAISRFRVRAPRAPE
jgi:hypothetical protein